MISFRNPIATILWISLFAAAMGCSDDGGGGGSEAWHTRLTNWTRAVSNETVSRFGSVP